MVVGALVFSLRTMQIAFFAGESFCLFCDGGAGGIGALLARGLDRERGVFDLGSFWVGGSPRIVGWLFFGLTGVFLRSGFLALFSVVAVAFIETLSGGLD